MLLDNFLRESQAKVGKDVSSGLFLTLKKHIVHSP